MGAEIRPTAQPALSGVRFIVDYRITGPAAEARARALDVCFEQTVEFPEDLVPAGAIRQCLPGRLETLETLETLDAAAMLARISYPVEAAGDDLAQLLNVLIGNTSLKPGIRVERFELPEILASNFRGPRYGAGGLRQLLGVTHRPLLSTALKPMGLSASDLAELAYRFALGGIDLIKDDHGLTDQPFSPFAERLERCVEAVERANRQTGQRCLYLPNVTAGPETTLRRARQAKEAGAGGLLISPALCGFDAMRAVADDDRVALPILSHPAFQGAFTVHPTCGFSHLALYGQVARLAGADGTIFPNVGGRFSFSREECRGIAQGCALPMPGIRTIFPVPAGGMSLAKVPELRELYGSELIILVGGGLFKHGPDLVENCRTFRAMAEAFAPSPS